MHVTGRASYDSPQYVSRGPLTDPACLTEVDEVFIEQLAARGVSAFFLDGMRTRMAVSRYKYGLVADAYPHKVDAIGSIAARVKKYEDTGNAEFLMDAGNFCMIERMRPANPKFHMSGDVSGWVGGNVIEIAFKHLVRYAEDGDGERLIAAAALFAEEFSYPRHAAPFFQGTDADQSPGRIEKVSGELVHFENRDIFA